MDPIYVNRNREGVTGTGKWDIQGRYRGVGLCSRFESFYWIGEWIRDLFWHQ